jgi:hypothetical protein
MFRVPSESAKGECRKQVLSAVLLHVIKAARPVDVHADRRADLERRRCAVRDAPVLGVIHGADGDIVQQTWCAQM